MISCAFASLSKWGYSALSTLPKMIHCKSSDIWLRVCFMMPPFFLIPSLILLDDKVLIRFGHLFILPAYFCSLTLEAFIIM